MVSGNGVSIMKKMTKIAAAVAALGVMASSLTGCGGGASGAISVIPREDGSGTRGAFTELCGIVADDMIWCWINMY